jgi:DNA helicase-2/ATP-dependent DNA helicase PcrA
VPAAPQARGPVVRRLPGALPGEPHIEVDDAQELQAEPSVPARPGRPFRPSGSDGRSVPPRGEPTVVYDDEQRPEAAGRPFARGDAVVHDALGEGLVLACDGGGRDAKVTVRFHEAGEKRVLARFLRRAG